MFGGSTLQGFESRRTSRISNPFNRFLFKPSPYTLLLLGVLIVLFLVFVIGIKRIQSASTHVSTFGGEKIEAPQPKAKQTLNREFSFSLKDDKGKDISKVRYIIESAEIHDELILKGQRAKAVKGRTFLILNLKIKNDFKQGIKINSRDYLRLSMNKASEHLAPDVHNDPVEVQAISTKYTRVGFPINESDKNLVLQVGEIEGKKESILLTLK